MTAGAWWRTAVIYQIYPRSFADADGDGVGDLPGIIARLDHLADLGVDGVWLSPFYVSPMADAGYDVADHRHVDPLFGSDDDAARLITEAKARGLRVVVDLVPNHTSDEHAWFVAARSAAPGSRERARYLFRDGRGEHGELPPNGWRSMFGGPAWTRLTTDDGTGEQWYLHLFDPKQPDLDWTDPEVREEFHAILRWWLDRGVDGFRVDVAHGLVKAEGLPEWDREQDQFATGRAPMWDQDGVHEIYRGWRRVLDSYDGDRMLVAEAWVDPPDRLARYVRGDEMHQAFNFAFLTAPWRAAEIREAITVSLATTAQVGATTTWVLSNHDAVRHPSRMALPAGTRTDRGVGPRDPQPDETLSLRRGRAATLLMLALPGGAYLYQGEELGLPEHTTLPDDARQDPTWFRHDGTVAGRDGCRVPIPWEADAPAYGFSSTGRSWLPQPVSYARYAVDRQDGVAGSTLELYREALRRRRALGLGAASLRWVDLGAGTGDDAQRSWTNGTGHDAQRSWTNGTGHEAQRSWTNGTVAFRVASVLVVTVLGDEPVALPARFRVVLASGDLDDDGRVPSDVTVWATS